MLKPTPIDEQYTFDTGLSISTTDLNGIIVYANKKFYEITGYSKEEIKSQNHNILRHSHMPKLVFKELWETIQSGKEWSGVMQNLRKDGKYYWVYAHISPLSSEGNIYGYTAIRRPASSDEIDEVTPVYTKMLKNENN